MKRGVLTILVLSCLFMGCIQQESPESCITKVAESGELLDGPPLVSTVEDPLHDFILDNPLFEEHFDVVYQSFDAIPSALDIIRVDLEREDPYYYFQIFTASDTMPEFLWGETQLIRFGVYVDTDLNGVSDIVLTTSEPGRGMVLTSDFTFKEDMPLLTFDTTSLTVSASTALLGDHFDWVAFTAYSPRTEAYYQTPLEDVYYVPEVDLAYADTGRGILLFASISAGKRCRITDTGISTCPPLGNPPGRRMVPGSLCRGWMLKQKECGNLRIELWCNCSSGGPPWIGGAFGKRIEEGFFKRGWVARCPFFGGQNSQVDEDTDNDEIPDKVLHVVVDMGADDDLDGYLDVMVYKYDFKTNRVIITNIERDYHTGMTVNARIFLWGPVPPFSSPYLVPGFVVI